MFSTAQVIRRRVRVAYRVTHSRCMSKGAFTQRVPFSEDGGDMDVKDQSVVQRSAEFLGKYNDLVKTSLAGGGPKGVERHVTKNRKVLIRERIKKVLDHESEFIEIGQLCGFDMPYGDIAAGGVVAGIGKINGVYCMISGNDATVKAGTYYPITVKKSGRVQEISESLRLPTVYMPDSGGAFLPLQSEIFNYGGRGFYNQAVMSSKGITQVALVCGSCTAGGAYNPTMSDEAIIVHKIGKIFLGGPPLVKAATGEVVTDEELGGGFMHSSVSGCTDYFAQTEAEAFDVCREIIESLNLESVPVNNTFKNPVSETPLNEFMGHEHLDKESMYKIIASIVDGSCFNEFKAFYGVGLITATAYVEGNKVGIIANVDTIEEAEGLKGAHFMDMCDRRNIPVVFLQNSKVSATTNKMSVRYHGARAAMSSMVAALSVPKLSLAVSGCHLEDHLVMCGPSFQPNLNLMWPSSNLSSFEMTEFDSVETMDAFSAAHNMIIDCVLLPSDTRRVIGSCLRIFKHRELNPLREINRPVFRL